VSAYQRRKGAAFERHVAALFRAIGYPEARRGLGQARAASEVPDVDGTPWWVEAKCGAHWTVPGAWRQARKARRDAYEATERALLLVVRRDRGSVMVVECDPAPCSIRKDGEWLLANPGQRAVVAGVPLVAWTWGQWAKVNRRS
jgi:hypothetical protein